MTKITKTTNLAKITNQGSERHKNNICLTRTREGGPTNITKIIHLAKISIGTGNYSNCFRN